MALLPDDQKQLNQQGQPDQQQQAQQPASTMPGSTGGVFAGSSSAPSVSTAGVGSGGTGGWTNIQSYLGANAGNTNSSDYMKSQVGGAFDKDKQDLSQKQSDAEKQADQTVQNNYVGQDTASKLVSQAAGLYNYNGNQSDQYKQYLQPVQQSLSATYNPTQYTAALSDKSTNYGSQLGDDQQFKNMMGGLYNQAANGQLGSGALALQQQLDRDNPSVTGARQQLQGDYQKLQNYLTGNIADTNAYQQNAQIRFGNDQDALRGYLGNTVTTEQGLVNKRVNDLQAQQDAFKKWFTSLAPDKHVEGVDNLNGVQRFYTNDIKNSYIPANGISAPTAENVSGVDDQRNRYNVLNDMLGLSDRIGKSDTQYKLGNMNRMYSGSDPIMRDLSPAMQQDIADPNNYQYSLNYGGDLWNKLNPIDSVADSFGTLTAPSRNPTRGK